LLYLLQEEICSVEDVQGQKVKTGRVRFSSC